MSTGCILKPCPFCGCEMRFKVVGDEMRMIHDGPTYCFGQVAALYTRPIPTDVVTYAEMWNMRRGKVYVAPLDVLSQMADQLVDKEPGE